MWARPTHAHPSTRSSAPLSPRSECLLGVPRVPGVSQGVGCLGLGPAWASPLRRISVPVCAGGTGEYLLAGCLYLSHCMNVCACYYGSWYALLISARAAAGAEDTLMCLSCAGPPPKKPNATRDVSLAQARLCFVAAQDAAHSCGPSYSSCCCCCCPSFPAAAAALPFFLLLLLLPFLLSCCCSATACAAAGPPSSTTRRLSAP